jgi:hypothetical protein
VPSLTAKAGIETAPGIVEITKKTGAKEFVDAARTGRFWDREMEQ